MPVPSLRTIDPELAALATLIPDIDLEDPVRARVIERAVSGEMRKAARAPDYEAVALTRSNGSELTIALHRPHESRRARRSLPALLFLHGGNFITGGIHSELDRCAFYADAADCLVISVDYRL